MVKQSGIKRKPIPWAQSNGKHIAVSLLIAGLIVYAGMLVLYAIGVIAEPVSKWPPHASEIPMSGLASFAIVSLLTSPKENPENNDEVEFEAFSLKFSGPAVPATLWIVVYLSIIASFKTLKRGLTVSPESQKRSFFRTIRLFRKLNLGMLRETRQLNKRLIGQRNHDMHFPAKSLYIAA